MCNILRKTTNVNTFVLWFYGSKSIPWKKSWIFKIRKDLRFDHQELNVEIYLPITHIFMTLHFNFSKKNSNLTVPWLHIQSSTFVESSMPIFPSPTIYSVPFFRNSWPPENADVNWNKKSRLLEFLFWNYIQLSMLSVGSHQLQHWLFPIKPRRIINRLDCL